MTTLRESARLVSQWADAVDQMPDELRAELRDLRTLAATEAPGRVSGEVCGDVPIRCRLPLGHDGAHHDGEGGWAGTPFAPAPTPSEPVGRLAVPVLCNLAGHPSRLHHHDRDGKVRMVPTPATRDE